jgi:uncharacterized protein involved in response to NO
MTALMATMTETTDTITLLLGNVAAISLLVGGIGIMTYGMISRVSLGHTGRKLIAGRSTIFGYVLLNLACALRVIGPIVSEGHMQLWVTWSGVFWIVSFALLLVAYAPMLLRARIDDPAA